MSISHSGANDDPAIAQEQQLRRLQGDLNIIRGATDDGLPFAQADVYFNLALSVSVMVLAIPYLLGQPTLAVSYLSMAPAGLLLPAYLVYMARRTKALRAEQPARSRTYRGKLIAALFAIGLCVATLLRFNWQVPFIIVESFFSLLGAALLFVAITAPSLSLAQRFRRSQYLWCGLLLLPVGFVLPLFRHSNDQGSWVVALVCMAVLLDIVSIANMVRFLRLQKNNQLAVPHGSN